MTPEVPSRPLAAAQEQGWPSRRAAPETEAVLAERVRAGDEAACEALVRAHLGRMLAVTRRILHNEQDAQDAVQTAFVSAFRSIHEFKGGSSLGTWLYRIATNAALMQLRAAARRPEASIEPLLQRFTSEGEHAVPVAEWSLSAETALLRAEQREQVRAAIARLPESYRVVLVLRDIEELDTGEAADLLGLTPAVVKLRLHRARQALRTLLAEAFAA